MLNLHVGRFDSSSRNSYWFAGAGEVSIVDNFRKMVCPKRIFPTCAFFAGSHLSLHCDTTYHLLVKFLKGAVCIVSVGILVDLVESWRVAPFHGCCLML